ncbi:MAG: metallophosphoesterase family protein [Halocynthiibacter sp.]
MGDHRLITKARTEGALQLVPGASPDDLCDIHRDHRAWLQENLHQPHPSDTAGKTVVVSHHGPHPSVAGNIDRLSPAFHSNLTDLLKAHDIDAWFFGHSHRHFRENVEGVDIRNISIGYPEERFNRLDYLDAACLWQSEVSEQLMQGTSR